MVKIFDPLDCNGTSEIKVAVLNLVSNISFALLSELLQKVLTNLAWAVPNIFCDQLLPEVLQMSPEGIFRKVISSGFLY